jgi:hypothetical protein
MRQKLAAGFSCTSNFASRFVRCFDNAGCSARTRSYTSTASDMRDTDQAHHPRGIGGKGTENQTMLSTGWLSEIGLDRPGFHCPAARLSEDARACKFRTPLPEAGLGLMAGSRGLTVVGK